MFDRIVATPEPRQQKRARDTISRRSWTLIRRLALVATTVLLAACASTASPSPVATAAPTQAPSASPVASTAAASTPTPTPSPTPLAGWQLLPVQPDLGAANLVDLASFHGALYAVGNVSTGDTPPGVIWTSTDGLSWKSASGSTSLAGRVLQGVAAGDPGVVVVGFGGSAAYAFFSADGTTWSVARLPNSAQLTADAVAWNPAGFVVTGSPAGEGLLHGATWWSADGRSWTKVTGIQGSNQPAFDAVAASPTKFLAIGTDGSRRAVWSSTNGRTWHKVETMSTVPTPVRARMRYANGRFLVPAGSSVWSSTDGRAWSRTTVPNQGNDVFDVAAVPNGFVAVGRSSAGDQPGEVAVADPNLSAWTALPEDPAFAHALALAILPSPAGDRLVGVGNSETGESILVADLSILTQP